MIALHSMRRAGTRLGANLDLVVVGAVSVAVYPLAFYSSMRLGGVAVGTVVSLASAPLASAVLDRTIEGIPLTRRWAGAAGLSVLGSTLVCVSRVDEPAASAAATVWSVLLGLLAGATYAVYSWATHRLMQRGVGRAASMGAVFGIGGLLLIPVLLATGAPLVNSVEAFVVATYMAVVPMFLGYLLFGLGLARVRPSSATILTLAEPALAALLAIVVVGERMAALGWIGLALIGVALALLTVPNSARPPAVPAPEPAAA